MYARGKLMAVATANNDCGCFRGPKKSSSRHNKSAKRRSSRILRQFDKMEMKEQLNAQAT